MDLQLLYKLYRENRIKKISNKMYLVGEYTVTFQTKAGRILMTCSCENHTKFCNSQPFCWHKNLVIVYPIFEYYSKNIEATKSFLKMKDNLGKEINLDELITLLNNIKEFE